MNNNILVFNCGSSSLKYRLIQMPTEKEIAGGEAQRIGPKTAEASRILHRENGLEETIFTDMPDHVKVRLKKFSKSSQGKKGEKFMPLATE